MHVYSKDKDMWYLQNVDTTNLLRSQPWNTAAKSHNCCSLYHYRHTENCYHIKVEHHNDI
jgi:hypothetical protein